MSSKENTINPEQTLKVDGLYQEWFLDYASYVILERAVPAAEDGLKPVQRRILHAMKEMDDGRFHKVANIIGQTMQYHPHGDAAIGDALVKLGQKDLMIECQGNWGDVRTGDGAAAPRYIEARLSKFALEVAYKKEITDWQLSYDGRKKEPVTLPMKFPLVLAQGAEGIAVGLSTKILPHNFCELCKGSIDILKGKKTKIYPDFQTGGQIDVGEYNRGKRGGKIRVRAVIEVVDKKTIHIKEIPYGITTTSLIDSIIKANEKGKIKIKKVVDNTAKDVEIAIDLPPGVSPEVTVDALYAFTNCEVSISPNTCVIVNDTPLFLTVDELLKMSTEATKDLLKKELELRLADLEEKWHFSSLEKIFIENRIYRDIEEEETWEGVISAIDKGLKPFKKLLKREVTEEDIVRLTEIKIKRISKYDTFKADEAINLLEEEIKQVKYDLKHLTDYAVAYFTRLLEKYGKGRERKTEIRTFDTIVVKQVAIANKKLFVNRKDGFIGMGLKQDELVGNCSELDDVIAFTKDGKMMVSRVSDKSFVGKNIIHVDVWKKGDDRKVYHMIYWDGGSQRNYVKRFAVTSITRDKLYDLTKGNPSSKVVYFTVHANSEVEVVTIHLHPASRAKNKVFDFSFGELAVKGRGSQGNIITKYPIRKVDQKELGESTLGGVSIWIDDTVGRLNKDERGRLLGSFDTGDQILVLHKDGSYEITNFDLSNRYEMSNVIEIQKLTEEMVISAIYKDGESKTVMVKRFQVETNVEGKKYSYVSETKGTVLLGATTNDQCQVEFTIVKGKAKEKIKQKELVSELIDIKGWKAMGNKLTQFPISGKPKLLNPAEDNSVEEATVPEEVDPPKKTSSKKVTAKKTSKKTTKDDGYDVGTTIDLSVTPKKSKSSKKSKDQGELF